jgi:hypothetical protein
VSLPVLISSDACQKTSGTNASLHDLMVGSSSHAATNLFGDRLHRRDDRRRVLFLRKQGFPFLSFPFLVVHPRAVRFAVTTQELIPLLAICDRLSKRPSSKTVETVRCRHLSASVARAASACSTGAHSPTMASACGRASTKLSSCRFTGHPFARRNCLPRSARRVPNGLATAPQADLKEHI